MYEPKLLRATCTNAINGVCPQNANCPNEKYEHNSQAPIDCRDDYSDNIGPACWLPHSCSEWVIGGPNEARALAADLIVFAERVEAKQKEAK